MDQEEAVKFAVAYLHEGAPVALCGSHHEYRLNRQLRYRLCHAWARLMATFGEVTRQDVALCCEAWLMAQDAVRPPLAIERMDTEDA